MFYKMGFNFLLAESTDSLFMNVTIYDYMWNFRSDLVDKVMNFAEFLVPTNNSGILYQVNSF